MKKISKKTILYSSVGFCSLAIATGVTIPFVLSSSSKQKETNVLPSNDVSKTSAKAQTQALAPASPTKDRLQWESDFPQFRGKINLFNIVVPFAFDGVDLSNVQTPNGDAFYLPDDLTGIEAYAFRGSILPQGFKLPDTQSFTNIESNAFANSIIPDNFVIPSSIHKIDSFAFDGAIIGNNFSMPGVAKIDTSAFEDVQFNGDVDLQTVTEIGDYAFRRAYSPTSIVSLTSSSSFLTTSTASPFEGYTNVKTPIMTWRSEFPTLANKITNNFEVIENGFFGIDLTKIRSTSGRGFYLPEGVTRINRNAFANSVLPTDLSFPSSLMSIGSAAFYNVKTITEDMKNWFISRRDIMSWDDIMVFKHSNMDNLITPAINGRVINQFAYVDDNLVAEMSALIRWKGINTLGKWDIDDGNILESKYHVKSVVPDKQSIAQQNMAQNKDKWGSLSNDDKVDFTITLEEDFYLRNANSKPHFSKIVEHLPLILNYDENALIDRAQKSVQFIGPNGRATYTYIPNGNDNSFSYNDEINKVDQNLLNSIWSSPSAPNNNLHNRYGEGEIDYGQSRSKPHSERTIGLNAYDIIESKKFYYQRTGYQSQERSGNIDFSEKQTRAAEKYIQNTKQPIEHVLISPDHVERSGSVQPHFANFANGDQAFFNVAPDNGYVFDPRKFTDMYDLTNIYQDDVAHKTHPIHVGVSGLNNSVAFSKGELEDLIKSMDFYNQANGEIDLNRINFKLKSSNFTSGINHLEIYNNQDTGWRVTSSHYDKMDTYDEETRQIICKVVLDSNYSYFADGLVTFSLTFHRKVHYNVAKDIYDWVTTNSEHWVRNIPNDAIDGAVNYVSGSVAGLFGGGGHSHGFHW